MMTTKINPSNRSSRTSIFGIILFLIQDTDAFTPTTASISLLSSGVKRNRSMSISCVESTRLVEDFVPPKTSKCHNHSYEPPSSVLDDLHLPKGLRQALIENTRYVFSKRIWLLDNSGSMKMMDGHEILQNQQQKQIKKNTASQQVPPKTYHDDKIILTNNRDANSYSSTSSPSTFSGPSTTRWAEVQETVNCHAQLSSVLGVPTDFRLLNPPSAGGPQNFRVGYHKKNIIHISPFGGECGRRKSECQRASKIMRRNQPSGKTPLHTAIQEIRYEVIRMLPQLRADGMKVALVVCTDGCNHDYKSLGTDNTGGALPTEPQLNRELRRALESLQGLPVCVVIRLCTDYGQIVDFYNDLDKELGELSFLDVLDDYPSEAVQVYRHNPWLNYSLILHRLREMGMQGSSALFDLLDERPFTRDEIRDFCALLFGTDLLPDPWYDWDNFVAEVDRLQQREEFHWDPQKEVMAPWIDIKQLVLQP